ncbi:YdbH domain-containing protein [Altererythrobacter sp. MF3-039]|uniref:intermembrane phospholipid transport protein YdbH family protein n=1 Tax=Altererythrobacter sp. MF3-039 TaxID=3252901 RepID=UPI00390C4519
MVQAEDEFDQEESQDRRRTGLRRWRVRISLGLLVILLGIFAYGWTQRERIADNYIVEELEALGLDATYDIESIGAAEQVLTNLVIGVPETPDFTAERVTVFLNYTWGIPTIGRVELVRPRLYGTYRNGELSFGNLDSVIFADSGTAPQLPDLDLLVVDGRGFLDTEIGPVGLFLEGEGELDSGFSGELAATAPVLAFDKCRATGASIFGALTTNAHKPRFEGPLRLARLACPEQELALQDLAIQAIMDGDPELSGFDAKATIRSASINMAGIAASSARGSIDGFYRDERLNSDLSLDLRTVAHEMVALERLAANGNIRANAGFEQVELQMDLAGEGARLGNAATQGLAEIERSARDNLLAPLLAKFRSAFEREASGSRFTAQLTARRTDGNSSLVVPEARLVSADGGPLLSISRLQLSSDGEGVPRAQGNFTFGGDGLPRISGRMEQRGTRNPVLRMKMEEYSAGESSLAVPEIVIAQSDRGQLGFAGSVVASGPLPGGMARELRIPIDGLYSDRAGLMLWRRCTPIEFDRLELANLSLAGNGLRLCPSTSGAILRSGGSGMRIAAGAPSLDLSGHVGDTPITIRSGPVGFAYPGAMTARDLDIVLGPGSEASRFKVTNLDAKLGEDVTGSFDEADIRLFAVPMNLLNAAGQWSFADGELSIEGGSFRLVDREEEARFNPLIARNGRLTLVDNRITAFATLREPASDRAVTDVAIVHNLESGTGHADIEVDGLQFDKALQPDDLTPRALGVIANANGTVTGTGRIEWSDEEVTSNGSFSSDGLDFAAAFGPVEGASGTVEFVDLINLTTAPGQTLKVASINPGIEIFDGEIEFNLKDGTALSLAGGTWPFLGGTLTIQPVDLNLGADEVRRYILMVTGMESSQFVERMELGNISATGLFDGTIPLVFDEDGNGRIEGGLLIARPPGGNLSYVGELTYEDLSAIANFAFDALRSLDYSEMEVRMDGSLTGEIVTRIRFNGVKQGEGARSNILTRRIAKLPIRFNINISAPFYQLITSLKAMYDPAFVRDPRELGLLSDDGIRLQRSVTGSEVRDQVTTSDILPDEPPIQSPESENSL